MASDIPTVGPRLSIRSLDRSSVRAWSTPAWGAIGATAIFLGITCWWLTQDRSIPIFDAGLHLLFSLRVHEQLAAGHLGRALTLSEPYPPFTYLIAALGIAVGGVGVAPPILAENLVFVPLLALGCYHVGRLAFGRTAGMLAVIFALGSPLILSLFHVIMIDGPETAMVAVSLWAILATENFSRVGASALAGLCVGLGMLTKEPCAFFVAGPLMVALLKGGSRNWRGLLAFTAVALVVAAPWYISELSVVHTLGAASIKSQSGDGLPGDIAPHRFSLDNLEWYAWNLINAQLFLPLFVFAAVGWLWTMAGLVRRKWVTPLTLELTVGAFVGWLAITETFVHDARYSMPLLVYLAVFAAGWITRLPLRPRRPVAAALTVVAIANTAGIAFGAGGNVEVQLPGANASFGQKPGTITIFSSTGFLAGAPRRDGDVLATLRTLKRNGVRLVVVEQSTLVEADFSEGGIAALTKVAGLEFGVWEGGSQSALTRSDAVLFHKPASSTSIPPCVTLSDGSGMWIVLGDPAAKNASFYCPSAGT